MVKRDDITLDDDNFMKEPKEKTLATRWVGNLVPKFKKRSVIEDSLDTLEQAFRLDATVDEACVLAGISPATYYSYMSRPENEEAKLRMEQARSRTKLIARAAVSNEIWKWNAKVALEFLKMRDKRYANNELADDIVDNSKVVQFISVNTNKEWDGTNSQWPTDTEQKLSSEWYVNTWENEVETKMTWWDNEKEMLKRLNS